MSKSKMSLNQLENTIDYAETECLRNANPIWNYFWLTKGGRQAVCRRCYKHFTGVFRPGHYRGKFNTARHLRINHPDLYQDFIAVKSTSDTSHSATRKTVGQAYNVVTVNLIDMCLCDFC